MLIFLIPIVLFFSCVALSIVGDRLKTGKNGTQFERWCLKHEGALSFSSFFSIGALVIMLLFLIGNRIDYASFPAEYESVRSTLNVSRNESAAIERAAVMHKVIDMNKELATVKYWSDSIWLGWFWPDRVAKLEYIK